MRWIRSYSLSGHLAGRFINVLLSTATIWLMYRVGHRFYNRTIGLISSGLLAVAMLHATNESRFALVDIPPLSVSPCCSGSVHVQNLCHSVALFGWVLLQGSASRLSTQRFSQACPSSRSYSCEQSISEHQIPF